MKKKKATDCCRVRTCAGYPMGFQVPRLNHSAKQSLHAINANTVTYMASPKDHPVKQKSITFYLPKSAAQ